MRNVATTGFWVLIAHLLLTFAPAGGPSVNRAYGAFPRQGTIMVNATGTLPPDGLSCPSGWRTIADGIAHASNGDVVMVCDSSTYGENVVMKDGVSLISEASQALGANFTAQDVLNACLGSSQTPSGLPTIQGTFGSVVTFTRHQNPSTLQGFRITGGSAPLTSGGGVKADLCKGKISIIGNCIDNNSATAGGGIGLFRCDDILASRNAIHENSVNGVVEGGGGLSAVGVKSLDCEGNLYKDNKAFKDGGGVFSMRSTTERHVKEQFLNNKSTKTNETPGTVEGYGGGAHHEEIKSITYDGCKFVSNSAQREGGGGLNLSVSTGSVTNCTFSDCHAGVSNTDPSTRELFVVGPGGGAIRVEGCTLDMSNITIDDCSTTLDGGGVLITSKTTPFNLDGVDRKAKVNLSKTTITHCIAGDDGGGLSVQVGSQAFVTDFTAAHNQTQGGNGGGFHTTCHAFTEMTNATLNDNFSGLDGGGAFVRMAGLSLLGNSTVTVNTATGSGGGLLLRAIKEQFTSFKIVYTFCDEALPEIDLNGVTWDRNSSSGRGGAVAVQRFLDGNHTIVFRIDGNVFTGNRGGSDTEAALEIALSKRPPDAPRRSKVSNCRFDNPAIQLQGRASAGPGDNFYDIVDCEFDVTAPAVAGATPQLGISLIQDSPTIKGTKTLFKGASRIGGNGIRMVSSLATVEGATFFQNRTAIQSGPQAPVVNPEILRCTFEDNAVGISGAKTAGLIAHSAFTNNGTAVALTNNSSPTISHCDFQGNATVLTKDGSSTFVNDHNTGQPLP